LEAILSGAWDRNWRLCSHRKLNPNSETEAAVKNVRNAGDVSGKSKIEKQNARRRSSVDGRCFPQFLGAADLMDTFWAKSSGIDPKSSESV